MAFTAEQVEAVEAAIVLLSTNPYKTIALNGRTYEAQDIDKLMALRNSMRCEVLGDTTTIPRRPTIVRQTDG